MSIVDKILDYAARSKTLLLQQYKGKEKIEGWQEAYDEQIQELEQTYCDMVDFRTIDTGFGQILDEIGEIVVQDRGGFADDFYKNLLKAKVGENTSQGDIAKILEITELLTNSSQVHLQEEFPAGISLSVNGVLDPDLINFYYQRLNRIDSAGVRVDSLICYDADEPFAFEGEPGPALGFGDATDVNEGGIFAELKIRTQPAFSFEAQAGVEDGDAGFSTIEDPLVGGSLVGL